MRFAAGSCPEAPGSHSRAIPSSENTKSVCILMHSGICPCDSYRSGRNTSGLIFPHGPGVAVLNDAKTSSETALEQALVENQTLKRETGTALNEN